MTKFEAAVISAYTGILVGEFHEMHKYIEAKVGRPVFTHEMGSQTFADEVKRLATDDFMKICKQIEGGEG